MARRYLFIGRAIFWIYAVVRTCVTPAIPAPLFGLPMLPAVNGAAIPANRSYKGFTAPLGARRGELKNYFKMLEEAERRDHRRLGREMGLFHLQEEAAGMAFWHDKGWTLYRQLESYIRRRQRVAGYDEVKTPQLVERKLWEDSGHWEKFRQHMYIAGNEEGLREYSANPQLARVFCPETDELPVSCADIQTKRKKLS